MKKHLTVISCILILLILFSMQIFAWDWSTHNYIAEKILLRYYPECKPEIDKGSIYPDKVLNDNIKHHCYTECPASDTNYCPRKKDCPAKSEADKWIAKANMQEGCEKAFSLAVASHYISDIYVPMHNLVNEDYNNCHKPFESKVGEAVSGKTAFPVTQCCEKPMQCFTLTEDDFNNMIKEVSYYLGIKQGDDYGIENKVTGNAFLSPDNIVPKSMLVFIIVAMIICLLLFFYFARKKKW